MESWLVPLKSNRIDAQFLSIISKDVAFENVHERKVVVLIRPNEIVGAELENVFLFV